jgi:hypothetical protein
MILSFRTWLESAAPFSYLSIGHNWDYKSDDEEAWVLPRGADDIKTSKDSEGGIDFFHSREGGNRSSASGRVTDFGGRIDHKKKMISVSDWGGDETRLEYLVSLLKSRYPNYQIWKFGDKSPKQL